MKIFVLFLSLLLSSTVFSQSVRLSNLNNKVSVSGSEKIPVSGSGNPSITPDLIKTYAFSNLPIYAADNGAIADGSTDNYTILQSLLDNNVGRRIIIGKNTSEIYIISKPLSPPTGSVLEINGTLKLKTTSVKSLTANATIGQSTISVDNSDGAFTSGQWIIISDNNKAVQGGGAWMTERVSDGNYITTATSTTLTLRTALISNFTTAASALVAHGQSVIILDNVSNVTLGGTGTIDNNSNASARLNPTNENGINESIRQMCGISVETCSNIRISDLTIKNAALHGVALHNMSYSDVKNINIDQTHGKGMLVWVVTNSTIKNIGITNSYNEDGFSMYNGNVADNIYDIRSTGARRYGLALIGSDNHDLNINGLIMTGNQIDIWVQTATNINIANAVVTGTHASQNTPVSISDGSSITMSNIIVDGVTCTRAFSISGTASAISIDKLQLVNMATTTGVTIASTASNIAIDNSYISGVTNCIEMSGGVATNAVFRKCGFFSYTSLVFGTSLPKFTKCYGTPVFVKAATSRIKSGTTFTFINHGLSITPSLANIHIYRSGQTFGSTTDLSVSDINATSFRVNANINPGTDITFVYVITDEYIVDVESEVTYTAQYTSNFTVGVDSWTSTRLTSSGNNDSVFGVDDAFLTYATNVAGTHDLQRSTTVANGSINRCRGKYYMPSGQTAVNGWRFYGNTFTQTVLSLNTTTMVYDAWTDFVTAEWTANTATVNIRLMNGNNTSFTGANSPTNDRLILKDLVCESR